VFNSLPAPILLDIAIFFTALSWGLGLYIVDRKAHIFASLAIGCFVCLLGYSVASLGAPVWAVIAAPVPLDLLLLWYVLRQPRKIMVRIYLTHQTISARLCAWHTNQRHSNRQLSTFPIPITASTT